MEIDGPSYIDPQTTQHLGDLNLRNQTSGIPPTSSSDDQFVEDFDSRKAKFNKQIGTKELQELIKEEASSADHTGSDPVTTKAKDTRDLELFKKPGESSADEKKDLHRVTSYNQIAPMDEDMSSDDEKRLTFGEEKKTHMKDVDSDVKQSYQNDSNANQGLNINDDLTKKLYEEVMGVSPMSE